MIADTTAPPTSSRLLVVEDDRDRANRYASWLDEDCDVRVASCRAEAREAFEASLDVILLRHPLPGGSSEEFLAETRRGGAICRMAMLTGSPPSVDILDTAFDDYLTTPVSRVELENTVDRLLTLRAYEETARNRHALAMQKARLETRHTRSELRGMDRYEALVARLEELETRLGSLFTDLDTGSIPILYRDADRGRTAADRRTVESSAR